MAVGVLNNITYGADIWQVQLLTAATGSLCLPTTSWATMFSVPSTVPGTWFVQCKKVEQVQKTVESTQWLSYMFMELYTCIWSVGLKHLLE